MLITNNQLQVLKKVVETLKNNKIIFQVTGGLAAIAYGSKRPLYDIDIDIYQRDVEKVRELFRLYLTKDLSHKQSEYWDIYIMTFNIDGVPMDVTRLEDWYYLDRSGEKRLITGHPENAKIINIEGIEIPVVEKDELIAYKKAAAREIDLDDVEQISKN